MEITQIEAEKPFKMGDEITYSNEELGEIQAEVIIVHTDTLTIKTSYGEIYLVRKSDCVKIDHLRRFS